MIRLERVSKTYSGGVKAVCELSLEVGEGEILVLLGTSGSGKTTTMKMINRLIEPTSGRIFIGDKNILEQNPIELRRKIGYAIQHIGLFPHMTVGENIGVVPRLLKWSSAEIASRESELLKMVGLEPGQFRGRYPVQLSGGQKQRVGVARALAADPEVILMDEPFGALDPLTREQLQDEFLDLQVRIQKTIVFVTHDIFEAVKLGDRIALLDVGRLKQLAPPVELVEQPANEFVSDFLGQHRFQLSLLTKTIKSVMDYSRGVEEEAPEGKPRHYLRGKSSLVEALDLFKTTGSSSLLVYEGDKCVGRLSKKLLLGLITEVLEEIGAEQ